MATQTTPDVELALLGFLAADADTLAALGTGDLGWNLGPNPAYNFLRVTRVGGAAEDAYLDQPLIQIEAIGAPDDQADATRLALSTLCRTAHGAILARAQNETHSGVRFSRVTTVTHMQWAPDPAKHQMRYFSRLLITAHRA